MTDAELRLKIKSLRASVHEWFDAIQRRDARGGQAAEDTRKDGDDIRTLAGRARDALASIQSLERIAIARSA